MHFDVFCSHIKGEFPTVLWNLCQVTSSTGLQVVARVVVMGARNNKILNENFKER
jgi:hypothetical protein